MCSLLAIGSHLGNARMHVVFLLRVSEDLRTISVDQGVGIPEGPPLVVKLSVWLESLSATTIIMLMPCMCPS